jgi:predicted nucleic acid-binding protein
MEKEKIVLCDTDVNALSHKLSLPDGFIAATALAFEITLYTLNEKDFRFIDGLKLYPR